MYRCTLRETRELYSRGCYGCVIVRASSISGEKFPTVLKYSTGNRVSEFRTSLLFVSPISLSSDVHARRHMPRVLYRRTTPYVASIGNKTDCLRGETVRYAAGGKVDRKEQIICSSVLRRPPVFVRRGRQFRARKFLLSRAFSVHRVGKSSNFLLHFDAVRAVFVSLVPMKTFVPGIIRVSSETRLENTINAFRYLDQVAVTKRRAK